ncbi:hypothetical protein SPHINGOT1_380009 [Sphingomonas sp. T1]|nr:hypothetical protein SPHINGOT1_380009 [Sphingomonas sp. T1]
MHPGEKRWNLIGGCSGIRIRQPRNRQLGGKLDSVELDILINHSMIH